MLHEGTEINPSLMHAEKIGTSTRPRTYDFFQSLRNGWNVAESRMRSKLIGASLLALPPLLGATVTWAIYRGPVEGMVDFEKRHEGGFIERFPGGRHGLSKSGARWTFPDSFIHLENLPAGSDLDLAVRLRSPRLDGGSSSLVWFSADGEVVHTGAGAEAETSYRFRVPTRSASLRLGIHSDDFWHPSGAHVGSVIHSVSFRGTGGLVPVPIACMFVASLGFLAAAWLVRVPLEVASGFATAISVGFLYLLSRDSVRFQAYPQQVLGLSVMVFAVALLLRATQGRAQWCPESKKPWLGLTLLGAFVLKSSFFLYPLFVSSDVVFQLHRFEEVLEGNFFPTSVTQHDPPFRIPYPISLYAFAAPWLWVTGDGVRLLQGVVTLAELGVCLALAFLLTEWCRDPTAGIFAAALYAVVPVNYLAFSAGNLTNLFGVSTTVFALTCLLCWERNPSGRALGLILFVTSTLALTSHFSTLLQAFVLWPLWLLCAATRPNRRRLSAIVSASVLFAGVYYLGYWDLLGQWSRSLEPAYATGETAVSEPIEKLLFTWGWESDGPRGHETRVTVRLTETDDGATLMRFEQRVFETEKSRDSHGQGWESSFVCLERLLES